MKFDFKRAGVLMMALVLLVPALDRLIPAASAAEDAAQGDPYVFQYMPSRLPADYGYTVPYFYMTPFTIRHTITREDGTSYYSGSSILQVFNLINTAKLAEGGEGTYASIAAYCADASADIRRNTGYRRINLEDAAYFESGAAGKIRAVVLNSFPRKGIKAIQVRANAWLRRQGKPEILHLQSGEAVLATQAAIWKLAGGDHYTVDALYNGRVEVNADSGSLEEVIHPSMADQQETDYTEQNVKSLYDYLCHLEAEEPRCDAISEAVFEDPVYTATKEPDGTYTVTVEVTLNIEVSEQDSLTVSAACGGLVQNQPVAASGEYRFVFRGLSEETAADLEISGEQDGGDVYFFDAKGGHDVSQPLVGYDSSRLPVQARITLGPDGVHAPDDETKIPESAPGIQMDVSAIGAKSGSFDVGESQTWIIRGGIPAGIGNARDYGIQCTIGYRLTYEQGSPLVSLYTKAGDTLLLRLGDHYTLEEALTNGNTIDNFTVSLTPAGMAYAAANLGRGENAPEIHVCFQAAINENAAMGEGISNLAHLNYTNSAGMTYGADSGISEVYTGGFHILKTDSAGNPLAGAVFQLARQATEAELSDPSAETVTLHIGEEERTVVFVSFYAEENLSGGKVREVTTGEDGAAVIYGLAYGEYYLLETEAPEGCNRQTEPITVIINGTSQMVDNTIRLIGTKFAIPETGGMGTTVFHVIGITIIGAACLLLLSNRNRKL